ncbi:MAG: hypothetical protein ACF8GE_06970 [Phycisphaerales bacterium JB043]
MAQPQHNPQGEASASPKKYQRLDHDGPEVLVTPDDRDKFVIPSDEAVIACMSFDQFKSSVQDKLLELVAFVRRWLDSHNDASQRVLFGGRNSELVFCVIRNEGLTSEDVADVIADLDIALFEHFPDLPVRVSSLSHDALDGSSPESYVNKHFGDLYAESDRASAGG